MLEGLKIIEMATYVAAPGAGGIMADWGADVIKVEPPGGDPIRMFFSSLGVEEQMNPVFDMDNRGKRGVILDTSKPAGRDALLKLLDSADVEGPDADRPGMDQAAFWARSGLAAMFRPKGGDPIMLRTAFGDHVASLAIVGAVMAAVYERQQTGKGRLIDASLLRAAHYAGSSDLAIQHTRGRVASNRPRKNTPNPLINYFQTGGGHWISLLQRQGEKDWPKLARALKVQHLVDDPRFANGRVRRENGAELVPLLDEAFAARSFDEIAAALDAEEMIWAPVLTAAEAIADPQAIAAGCVVQTPRHDGGVMNAPAGPVRFPGADDGPKGPSPRAGEHTRAVLLEAGYSGAEIDAMYASGAAA